ncbi:hypothetical protein NC653_033845 [Populus alba x Populus x berolinensis]|uniref:Uncharacterized protein n=1 Tax=Populus alba x Populus x berolinensis TaxID=444605 RepID=A0AAD6LVW5_9ROSI|nr:hypothetical protein NC653_033845 [Populus alba x Populus x berolinensis]KAJ6973634.1 hypothetical protein NC653_033845 [Populus alba x Populus x berolinensis]
MFPVLLPLWKQRNEDVMEDWWASCFLPPLLVVSLRGLFFCVWVLASPFSFGFAPPFSPLSPLSLFLLFSALCRFSFSGFYNQRMPCGCMDFNATKACVFFLFSGEEDEQC